VEFGKGKERAVLNGQMASKEKGRESEEELILGGK